MLFVPDLDCNLLFVSKISQDCNCITKFSKKLCEFQDLDMRRTIGSARQYSGLYLLSSTHSLHGRNLHVGNLSCSSTSFNVSIPSSNNRAMLWHFPLGHPNFTDLEKLFPLLFKNKNSSLLQCEVCQLSKHTRNTFQPQPYKPSHPFAMFHSDIWELLEQDIFWDFVGLCLSLMTTLG